MIDLQVHSFVFVYAFARFFHNLLVHFYQSFRLRQAHETTWGKTLAGADTEFLGMPGMGCFRSTGNDRMT